MTSFLKHRLSQVLGSEESPSPPSRQDGAASRSSDVNKLVKGSRHGTPAPQRPSSEPGLKQEGRSRQSSRGQVAPQVPEPKQSLQELASNTLKTFSRTLRSKAQYFYTDVERAKQATENDLSSKLGHSRKISTSRLIDSFKKHAHSMSGKGRRGHTRQDSVEELAKMDPSSFESPTPSLDVSIPDSALWESGQRAPWVGSRRGRNLTARSRGSIIDPSNLWPSPVVIAARRSSIGATNIFNRSQGDSSMGQKPDGTSGPQQPARERSESESTVPLVQRRMSVYKHFQRSSSSTIDLLRENASPPPEIKSAENVADAAPSMGPKVEWDETRAERQRRYEEIIREATPRPVIPEVEHALDLGLPESPEPLQQALRSDSASVKSVCDSESSGSHYNSDDDQGPGAIAASEFKARADDMTDRYTLEKMSISGESWTTSPENAIEDSPKPVLDNIAGIEQALKGSSPASIKSVATEKAGLDPAGEDVAGDSSPNSESTAASCAVSTQKPVSPISSSEKIEHHRTLSIHGDDIEESQPSAVGTLRSREWNENQMAQNIPLPGSTDSFRWDVASNTTESTKVSLPPLRRMPGMFTSSVFRTSSPVPSHSGSEASDDLSVVLPAYNNSSPRRSVERIICDEPPVGEAATIEDASTTASLSHASAASDSSSSVGSWLRSHPDFAEPPNLDGLRLQGRTLSAELLRFSYLHGCAPPRGRDASATSTAFSADENLALSETHRAFTIRPSGPRHSSSQDSVHHDADPAGDAGASTPSPGRRESLIPIPVNSSRLNVLGDARARASDKAASSPAKPVAAAAVSASRELETLTAATPTDAARKSALPAQLHAHRFTTPASDPVARQVRFPDDTAETLAARGAPLPSGHVDANAEPASSPPFDVQSAQDGTSPTVRKRRSLPRIPVPKTHQKWSPVRSKRW